MNKPRMQKWKTEHGQELWMCYKGNEWYVATTAEGAYQASCGKVQQTTQKQLDNVHTALKHVNSDVTKLVVVSYETQRQLENVKAGIHTLLALFILCVPILFALVWHNI